MPRRLRHAGWDLTALLNAADARAPRAQRHLWLVRLVEWLRHGSAAARSPADTASPPVDHATPGPLLRLTHLLNVLERNPAQAAPIRALLARWWRETDVAALFADTGFSARRDLWGELKERLRLRLLPLTPDTDDGATLLQLLFTNDADPGWLGAIDASTLGRVTALLAGDDAPRPSADEWRAPLLQAMTWLVSAIRAAAFSPPLRSRMSEPLLADRPFDQLIGASERLREALQAHDPRQAAATLQHASYLRALLESARRATASVMEHLDAQGVSVDIVFEVEQLQERMRRLEALVDVLVAPAPAPELVRLLADLVRRTRERRSLRALLASHYALLARKVAERHAETGEHYITRTRAEYRAMLGKAAGGGVVIAGTTFAKFAILALGLAPFWAGFGAGLNYAASFLVIHLLHWTVATKQPAMTAPAMAEKLADLNRDDAVAGFVDEVTHLVRSQIAGIAGNLALVTPVVLAVQGLAWWLAGRPLIGPAQAHHVLESITLLGPTALFAAFTGVLLFASSLVAGWAENWFVYHRLDSALAHHPDIVARLGAPRAARWAAWWRRNVSGVAGNVSLGLMLGLVPALLAFVGVPLDVRHVTLSTGQLAAALGTLGPSIATTAEFWWCVAGLLATGALNLGVSFLLALKVALRSRGIATPDRRRLYRAIWRRLRRQPASFLLPPKDQPSPSS